MGYEEAKNGNLNTQIERCFGNKIRPTLKMQKNHKIEDPGRQFFKTITFAFMKYLIF